MRLIRFRCAALLSAALLALPTAARAQDAPPEPRDAPASRESRAAKTATFLAGGAAGLIVHEAGHIAMGLALDANPGFKRLDYGVIPFFAVTHDSVTRRRELLISASGFLAQHAANEWLLMRDASGRGLRQQRAPFKKGWLIFNLATSAVYTAAALGRFGPAERDTRGIAISAGDDGVPEPVVGVLILAPAVLDGVRYWKDDPAWARWGSRALKAGMLLLALD